jgi:hypothetical protein
VGVSVRLVFQCKSFLFARFLVRFCDHAVCNPGADGENIVTTSCGADRRPSRFTSTRRWSPGIFCSGIGCVTGLHTLSPWPPAPSSSVCPVSRLSSRALRARTLVFTFCLRRQLTAPKGLLPDSSSLALHSLGRPGPREEERRPRRATLERSFSGRWNTTTSCSLRQGVKHQPPVRHRRICPACGKAEARRGAFHVLCPRTVGAAGEPRARGQALQDS